MAVFKAAVVQMRSGMDPERNATDMEALVREAAGQGATYVQTPEMTGAMVREKEDRARLFVAEERDVTVAIARRLAKELGIFLHIGSTAIRRDDGKSANRALLISPRGETIATYDKIHMFDVDLDHGESWRESAAYEPGTRAVTADVDGATLGLAICYDLRFPQLFRTEALAGAEVLTVPAAFTRQTGEAHWEVLLRARAIENGVYIIAAAQAGVHEDGRETFGHSMIIDPWGRVLASSGGTGEAVVLAEVEVAAVKSAHDKIPNLRNGRAFTLDVTGEPAKGGVAA